MTSIHLRFQHNGVRWFEGKKINENYEEIKKDMFGYLLQDQSADSDSSEEELGWSEGNVSQRLGDQKMKTKEARWKGDLVW